MIILKMSYTRREKRNRRNWNKNMPLNFMNCILSKMSAKSKKFKNSKELNDYLCGQVVVKYQNPCGHINNMKCGYVTVYGVPPCKICKKDEFLQFCEKVMEDVLKYS